MARLPENELVERWYQLRPVDPTQTVKSAVKLRLRLDTTAAPGGLSHASSPQLSATTTATAGGGGGGSANALGGAALPTSPSPSSLPSPPLPSTSPSPAPDANSEGRPRSPMGGISPPLSPSAAAAASSSSSSLSSSFPTPLSLRSVR